MNSMNGKSIVNPSPPKSEDGCGLTIFFVLMAFLSWVAWSDMRRLTDVDRRLQAVEEKLKQK